MTQALKFTGCRDDVAAVNRNAADHPVAVIQFDKKGAAAMHPAVLPPPERKVS